MSVLVLQVVGLLCWNQLLSVSVSLSLSLSSVCVSVGVVVRVFSGVGVGSGVVGVFSVISDFFVLVFYVRTFS